MSRRRPTLPLLLALSLLASLAACGDDDAGATDAGPPPRDLNTLAMCPPSDGTIAGDCARFACEYRNASLTICPGATTLTFNCAGVEGFPMDYQTRIRSYFTDCGAALSGIRDTEVETTMGPVTIPACDILKCVSQPESRRLFMGGPNILAECAPVPAPACDFPDPPM
jgi:hypothetical protein